MANFLGSYDPVQYAATALVQLEKALGMASRVYRGYDKDPREYGSTINLRRPSYFGAQAMPISTSNTSDLNTDTISISLNQWYGVQFALTDKELSYTQERIVDEHIRPAAIAVADQIDQSLNSLAIQVPWYVTAADTGTASQVTDIQAIRRRMFDNAVRQDDLHLQLNGEREQYYLSQNLFVRANEAANGPEAQLRGNLGEKFGFEIFANQNVATNANAGAAITLGGTLTAATATVSSTSLTLAAATLTGTLNVGDIIQVGTGNTAWNTGSSQPGRADRNFVVTAQAVASGNSIAVNISPTVKTAISAGARVAITQQTATNFNNLGFHRNAFALAMAPLPETARQMGAIIASVTDPITGLALRVTMWYVGADAKIYCRIDALWGVASLNPDMAVRYWS